MLTTNTVLAPYTTLHVGGPAREFIEASDADALIEAARRADDAGIPLLVIGSGSNVMISDEGFDGIVVRTKSESPIVVCEHVGGTVVVKVPVGSVWDDTVAFFVQNNLSGLEALSGIPGQIGSAIMQNLGAYGQEIGSRLVEARLWDRKESKIITLSHDELELGYRTSLLRVSLESDEAWGPSPRWIVLDATFKLDASPIGKVSHKQLADALGCELGSEMPISQIRDAVIAVRTSKSMVADNGLETPDYDRWSSGSFFTNPIVDKETADNVLPENAPRYPVDKDGYVKTSAAWLIEHAGFGKGFGVHGDQSKATLSTKHTLAITNRGSADCRDLVELASHVRKGVLKTFGITLVPETVLVGVEILD